MLRYPLDSPFGRAMFTPSSVLMFGLGLMLLVQQVLLPFALLELFGAFTGTDYTSVVTGDAALEAQDAEVLKVYMLILQILAFGLMAWIMARAAGSARQELRIVKAKDLWLLLLAIPLVLAALPLLQLLTWNADTFSLGGGELEEAIKDMEARGQRLQQALLKDQLFFNIIITAVTPALMEEFFFRGFLLSTTRRMMNVHLAILLVAFIFSFIHFQFYGFFYRMGLGVLFGYMVYWSGSIWPAVLAHFSNNLLGVVIVYGAANWGWSQELADDSYQLPWQSILGGLIAFSMFLWLYLRRCRSQQWPPAGLPYSNSYVESE